MDSRFAGSLIAATSGRPPSSSPVRRARLLPLARRAAAHRGGVGEVSARRLRRRGPARRAAGVDGHDPRAVPLSSRRWPRAVPRPGTRGDPWRQPRRGGGGDEPALRRPARRQHGPSRRLVPVCDVGRPGRVLMAGVDDLMMHYPLTIQHIFERTRRLFPKKTLATRVPGVGLVRSTYADFAERTRRLAGALKALGVGKGDRVGTFAWNSHRHLEAYFAPPLMGAVLHTVNIRLSAQDITYIVNHAADRVLIVDASCWPTLEPIRKKLETVEHVIVMKDTPGAQIPPGALDYEALLAAAQPMEAWPALEETDAAGMCYTSGTTGHPKAAVYTHRAIFLHSLASSMTDVLAIGERDVILHIVPMFHANAWCVPFAGVMNGATQIFGGPNPQPRDIIEIVHNERVTFVGAVPTVWIAIDAILEQEPQWDISSIRCIPIGGSAAPRTLIEHFDKKYGAYMLHAWGMTEMTPLGTVCRLK